MRKFSVFIFAFFAIVAYAADFSGTWKGTAELGDRTIERTFVFKVDGSKLTGETSSEMMGKSTITDGVVKGDEIRFSFTGNFQGNEMKLDYKGRMQGDQLTLSSEVNGQAIEWKLKKIS